MLHIEKYKEEKKSEWNQFCASAKNTMFMFQRDYMEYHSDRFKDFSLMFYDDEKLIAILPMNIAGHVLYSHQGLTYGGFLIDKKMKQKTMNECVKEFIKYARREEITSVIYKLIPHIYHNVPSEEDQYALFLNGAKLLKIEPATVVRLSNLLNKSRGRKSQINRAIREGVVICELTEEKDYYDFISLQNQVLKKRHNTVAVHSGKEIFLLHSKFPENIRLFAAFYNSEMVAGTIVYEYQNVVHTQYLAANDIARKIGALDLCIDYVIKCFQKNKEWLDFGISTEENGRKLNQGLISQKEGFGGRTVVYSTCILDLLEK